LIAGPTRALISKALQAKTAGTSITHSATFLSMQPRDRYASYSAVVYENLGRTLAPLIGMFGSFIPPQARTEKSGQDALTALGNMKPVLLAAYAEGDQITIAGGGNMLGKGISSLLGGNLLGVVGGALPLGQMQQERRVPAGMRR
jgi:hypothetical protein